MFEAVEGLIDFWFRPSVKVRWFDGDPALDATLRERFGPLHGRAAAGELDALEERPAGSLALCLLLDQLPRNIFRATPRAFATDAKARGVATRAVDRGFDRRLPEEFRTFLYLPFELIVFFAAAQIPMYTLPVVQRPFCRRLLRRPDNRGATVAPGS